MYLYINISFFIHCFIPAFFTNIDTIKFREKLKKEVSDLKAKTNKVPGLTVILIGELGPSKIYVKMKEKAAIEVGLKSEIIRYPDSVEEKTVLEKINELNSDMFDRFTSSNFLLSNLIFLSERKVTKFFV